MKTNKRSEEFLVHLLFLDQNPEWAPNPWWTRTSWRPGEGLTTEGRVSPHWCSIDAVTSSCFHQAKA